MIADSGPFFYELFVDRLDEDERERLWQEYVRFGELFGMPREVAPASHREFREWFEGMLGSLPARVRELYGVDYSRRQQRAFRAVVRGLRGARPLTPRSIREGYNTGHFRMVARTERRRLRRGERTPQVAA